MPDLLGLIKALISIPSQDELDAAYLAEAVDVCDLERLMREVDDRGRDARRADLNFAGRR